MMYFFMRLTLNILLDFVLMVVLNVLKLDQQQVRLLSLLVRGLTWVQNMLWFI